MNLFLAGTQGLGLALAAGMFAGAAGRRGPVGTALMIAAIVGGAIMFGASLTPEDHPAWPGWLLGALAAAFSCWVTRDVAEGALAREGGGTASAMIALAALALAGISLLFGPVSLVALAALAYLALARRRRAARKYEGLRSLR